MGGARLPPIETGIEIDYQLSQAGRALKYSADPTLLIKEPAGIEGELVRGAGNALVLSERGDAKLLEIGGGASAAVLDYVRFLRELALEAVHGNRADPQRSGAPASGRAMEMMQQGLLWLAGSLRVSYGEGGLLPLARMLLRAHARYPLRVGGKVLAALDAEAGLGLAWPPWQAPGSEERAPCGDGRRPRRGRLANAGLRKSVGHAGAGHMREDGENIACPSAPRNHTSSPTMPVPHVNGSPGQDEAGRSSGGLLAA